MPAGCSRGQGQAVVGPRPGVRRTASARSERRIRSTIPRLLNRTRRARPAPATWSVGVIAPRRPRGADGGRQFQGRLLLPRLPAHPIIDALSNTLYVDFSLCDFFCLINRTTDTHQQLKQSLSRQGPTDS